MTNRQQYWAWFVVALVSWCIFVSVSNAEQSFPAFFLAVLTFVSLQRIGMFGERQRLERVKP